MAPEAHFLNSYLWLLVPMAPLLAAALVLAAPTWLQRLTPWLWLSAVPAVVFSFMPPAAFTPDTWWPGARWAADTAITRPWLAFTALLWGCAGFYAAYSQRRDRNLGRFWLFWQVSFSGNLLLIIAQDALSFYVGFSMMSLSAYSMVIHSGKPTARRAGRLYMQLAIFGEILLFTGMAMRSHETGGTWLFSDWAQAPAYPLSTLALLVGLGLKAGFWPLHVWLPLAHPAAPAPASAVLSGAMLKAGILGLWQFLPGVVADAGRWTPGAWSQPLMAVALTSMLLAALLGLLRRDAKQVLAYSSISQMGFLLFLIALGWHLPEQRASIGIALTLYAVHHGFAKGALFLAADVFKDRPPGNITERRLRLAVLAIPALALTGLPLTSGAAAKTALKALMEEPAFSLWLLGLQLAAAGTTLIVARACYLLYLRARLADKSNIIEPLARPALCVWLALCFMPLLVPWLWPSMRAAALDSLPLYKWVDLGVPIIGALLLSALALYQHWSIPGGGERHSPFLPWSLHLKRHLHKPPMPHFDVSWRMHRWRARERRWNRLWRGHTVNQSAIVLLLFMIVAGLTIFRFPFQ